MNELSPTFGYVLIGVGLFWLLFSLGMLAWLARRPTPPGRPIPYRPDAATRTYPRVPR